MAEITSTINNTTAVNPTYGTSDNPVNPDSILDKDSFMKLLLVQLQNQDPTSPTDTDKILSQTADLATLEAQENTKTALESMVKSYQGTAQYALISSVGKIADTGQNAVSFEERGEDVDLEIYMGGYAESATITIKSTGGEVVRKIAVPVKEDGSYYHGLIEFGWDGRDEAGAKVEGGTYVVTLDYTNPAGTKVSDPMGRYPIESVRVSGTEPELKMAGSYYKMSDIQEILDPNSLN